MTDPTTSAAHPYREKALIFRVPRRRRDEAMTRIRDLGFQQVRRTFDGRVAVEYHYKDERRLLDFVNSDLSCVSVRIRGLSLLTSADFS